MIKLFTPDSETSSAQRLGFQVLSHVEGYSSNYLQDVCVRWGFSGKVYQNEADKRNKINYGDFPNVINSRRNIRFNVNKLLASEKLGQVVNVPRIFRMEVPNGVKAVVRPHEHSSGNGFSVVNGPIDIDWREMYGTEFIPTEKEFRCWWVGNKTMVGRRIATTPEQQRQHPCRSKWGYSFVNNNNEFPKLREQTLLAARTMGLEMGAADVLWDEVNRKYYILELNSSPTIEGRVITDFFRNGIIEVARQKFPNLRIDITPFNNGVEVSDRHERETNTTLNRNYRYDFQH